MQQPVRADRPEVRNEHAEHRVEILGKEYQMLGQRVRHMGRGMTVRCCEHIPWREHAAAGRDDLGHFHVPEAAHRVHRVGHIREEKAELGIETGPQPGMVALDEGQLGAGGQARGQGLQQQPALGHLGQLFVHDVDPAG